jgi:ubiquinone/menaquinone biosynthesis C-methylase UbiE
MNYAEDIFPYVTELFMNNPIVNARRRNALSDVRGDALEVGFGSGLNLPHYPPGLTRLVALDPSAQALRLAAKRIRSADFPILVVDDTAESMNFPDNTFDSVISTWTLCSVCSPAQALRNMRRVLRPEGRLFFLEHGLSDEPQIQRYQALWTPIQRVVCAGCRLTMKIDDLIKQAGFTLLSLKKGYMTRPKTLAFVYEGIAAKS